MGHSTGRRRLTCYHEAGHCLGRWYFGFATHRASVLTQEQVRFGCTIEDTQAREVRAEGSVDGHDIHFPYSLEMMNFQDADASAVFARSGPVRAEIALINCFIGVVAEARFRRASLIACFINGGSEDLEQAQEIADLWLSRSAAPLATAQRRAQALVRSTPGWAAISAVADQLWARGEIDGDHVDELCQKAFNGRSPVYDCWADHWPPALSDLRAGVIPNVREPDAS